MTHWNRTELRWLWMALVLACGGCANPDALRILKQGSFFVGGQDVVSDSLSTGQIFPDKGTITKGQMYVRFQEPARASGLPLVFIHGCCLTGKTWETTPDGRAGWDEWFLRAGHAVYTIDQVSRGRSAADTSNAVAVKVGKKPAAEVENIFFMPHEAAWEIFRFGPRYPTPYPGIQFPLESLQEFWKQMVPDWNFSFGTVNPNIENLAALTRKTGPAILVSHSQSGIYPFLAAQADPPGVAGIVAVEPAACPVAGEPLGALAQTPTLILWGEHNEKSAFWAPRMKQCQDFAVSARQAGAPVDFVMLSDVGFPNASHMLMQDRNSHDIARWVQAWIVRAVRHPR